MIVFYYHFVLCMLCPFPQVFAKLYFFFKYGNSVQTWDNAFSSRTPRITGDKLSFLGVWTTITTENTPWTSEMLPRSN